MTAWGCSVEQAMGSPLTQDQYVHDQVCVVKVWEAVHDKVPRYWHVCDPRRYGHGLCFLNLYPELHLG